MSERKPANYALMIAANHEMYAVEPGWRLFAVCLSTGAAYEMEGGFSTEALAIACRDSFIESRMVPSDEPGTFTRLSMDAVLITVPPPLNPDP